MNLFFELLQIVTGNRKKFSSLPSEEQWRELFDLAEKQTLTGMAFYAIERLPQEQRPPKALLMKWYMATERIKALNAEMNAKAVKVANRFLKDGFRSVILKGQGIATLYPDASYRTPGDIDIWIEGGRERIVAYLRGIAPDCKVVYHHADFLPIGGTEIEVHFTPSWMNCYFNNRRLQRYFREKATEAFCNKEYLAVSDDGTLFYKRLPVPSLAFNRVFILVHIYRHLFGEGIGLRQLMDYYFVLCQGFTEEDRKETLQVLGSLKMLRFAGAVMYVLQRVFGMDDRYLLLPPDEKEGRFLLNEIMMAGNFGHYDERIKRNKKDGELNIFLRRVTRNFRFLKCYPSEVLWSPLFKIWHYFMRQKWNGGER